MLSRALTVAGIALFVVALLGTTSYGNHYLRSIDRRESHIVALNRAANAGLDQLEPKTARLQPTNAKAGVMVDGLRVTNSTLGRMERSVGSLNRRIALLSAALARTRGALGGVSGSTGAIAGGIGRVNEGLGGTASEVSGISLDVGATRAALASFPGQLGATNDRLAYINVTVGRLGDAGISSDLVITVLLNKTAIGKATIKTTIIPRDTWKLP